MSVPMDPPYCLVYPTTYVKGAEPDHFNTRNSPAGTCLHRCVCRATLQFSNTDPQQHTKYTGSCLIVPRGAQYNDRLYPAILELRYHRSLLIDPITGEPCPKEVVGDFRATDPIFKGSYGDSFLYSEDDLARLRWQKVYLPTFQEEIPMPPTLSYRQSRELVTAKQSQHRAAALDVSMESPKTRHSSSKSRPPRGTGRGSKTSTPKHLDSTSAKTPPHPQESTLDHLAKSPQAHSSQKHGRLPSPTAEAAESKWRGLSGIASGTIDTTLPLGSSTMDTFLSPTGSLCKVVEPLAPSITSTPLGHLRHAARVASASWACSQSTTCISSSFATWTRASQLRCSCSSRSPSLVSASPLSDASTIAPSSRDWMVCRLWLMGTRLSTSAAPVSAPFWYSSSNWNEPSTPTHQCPVASRLGIVNTYVSGLLSVCTTNGICEIFLEMLHHAPFQGEEL